MSHLSRHISALQARRAAQEFLLASIYAVAALAALTALGILFSRLIIAIPHPLLSLVILLIAAITAAIIFAIRSRPSAQRAAAMIDQKLDLHERLSTAIAVADRSDVFSQAVCADAEQLAGQINLRGKFPLHIPQNSWITLLTALLLALLIYWLAPSRISARTQLAQLQQQQQAAAKKVLADAFKKIEAQAHTFSTDPRIQKTRAALRKELANPPKDPAQANRDAAKALQQVAHAANERSQQSLAAAQTQQAALSQLKPTPEQKGSIADAQKALAQNNPAQAQQSLQKAVQDSKTNSAAQKLAAAKQMQQLSQALKQASQNQQTQQALQNQLQQMGLSQQQVQQMQNTPANQQASALSKLQPNLSPSQQMQAMRLMQKLSADAKARQQMQAMSKSAQQMSQAMQKNNAQQMAQANQQMQQQLSQMQSQQDSAKMQCDKASQAQQSADASVQSLGQNGPPTSASGPPGNSASNGAGNQHSPLQLAPPTDHPAFSIRVEAPPAMQPNGGKILADFLVKGGVQKGEAKQQLQTVVTTAQQQAAEDADQETIDAGARRTVKEYFQAVDGK